ncbi:hypothetical protein [Limnoglobus roseus]|uniref:Uncharacterized protein n=1 Tax=Limnoglobus roseus TaxID=2598579 RepID=A0A5C1AJJ6_9BACT|nr:hypothetical protein [Limnoglobus roseus]QEL18176.1 hypothetical protein PX52LOC_05190 [Limnoglobus roseus]
MTAAEADVQRAQLGVKAVRYTGDVRGLRIMNPTRFCLPDVPISKYPAYCSAFGTSRGGIVSTSEVSSFAFCGAVNCDMNVTPNTIRTTNTIGNAVFSVEFMASSRSSSGV